MNIALHSKLTTGVAIQLLQIVLQISRKNIIFTRISLKLVISIANRFKNDEEIIQFLKEHIKQLMKIIIS
jgi:hypothetical protein